ncbi:GNAT family N-acetyltransferase [Fulvivirga lutea]|uniref:GNAT family N-acetyltransferase n=1 Tax=Fulvivirga lutea TaxID=2810512 RepID=A0A975A1V7_9BACT|nr:GNAT family N-acetyltransferase [Fulvivirga lutea]QSE98246.1 GNAT family N-acetyltransferase [Fulvivirga lutea]
MSRVRPAKFKELEIIADFQAAMALETEGLHLDKEKIILGIEAVFEDPGKGKYYVVTENEDEVIACLLITPEWSEWRNGTVYWIQSVFVKKEHRGKGIFKELYQYIQNLVKEDPELVGIRLYVERENKSAQAVYEKLGMNGEHYKLYEWLK